MSELERLCKRLQEMLKRMQEEYAELLFLVGGLEEKLGRYKAWVRDLQSGMYVNCVYCGHRYGPQDETPVSMAELLKQHIEQCPEHPLYQCKTALSLVCSEFAKLNGCPKMEEFGIIGSTIWQGCSNCPDTAEAQAQCWERYFMKKALVGMELLRKEKQT